MKLLDLPRFHLVPINNWPLFLDFRSCASLAFILHLGICLKQQGMLDYIHIYHTLLTFKPCSDPSFAMCRPAVYFLHPPADPWASCNVVHALWYSNKYSGSVGKLEQQKMNDATARMYVYLPQSFGSVFGRHRTFQDAILARSLLFHRRLQGSCAG